MLRLDASALDYAILAVYFLVVLGIGAVARLSVKTVLSALAAGGARAKSLTPRPPTLQPQGSRCASADR
jgi:hypothetical protein